MGQWAFRQAVNFHRGRLRAIRFIVLHDMEYSEGPQTAEAVANYFANQPASNAGSSAHFPVDVNSVVQCVKVSDTAWAAPGANADGVHIELPGFSTMTREEWLADDLMLNIGSCVAAELVAGLRFLHTPIEVRHLSLEEIAGPDAMGFCSHLDTTRAFGIAGGHTDPGDAFPWDVFLDKVDWWLGHITSIDFTW